MNLSKKIAKLIVEKGVNIEDVAEALKSYGLLSLMPSVLDQVKRISKSVLMKDTLKIETPFEISEESIKRIKSLVGDERASHEITINKNILAGFKARFKEKLYDASAERIIKQLVSSH